MQSPGCAKLCVSQGWGAKGFPPQMTLAEYQEAEGLTLTKLAARLGRPVPTVHCWLKGIRRPSWAELDNIVDRTGGKVTAADFHRPAQAPAA